MIAHNIFDVNTQAGVELDARSDVRIFNNTFYSATGDNIRIEGNSSDVEIQNNILWADGGYDIYVDNNSQSGFYSDYNDLNAGPGGTLVYWTKDFTDVLDWQDDVAEFDLHSIGTTVINPQGAQPQFLNRGQGDFQVFPVADAQRGSSPTIGLGNPISRPGTARRLAQFAHKRQFRVGSFGLDNQPGLVGDDLVGRQPIRRVVLFRRRRSRRRVGVADDQSEGRRHNPRRGRQWRALRRIQRAGANGARSRRRTSARSRSSSWMHRAT